jgi:hypothetical protein
MAKVGPFWASSIGWRAGCHESTSTLRPGAADHDCFPDTFSLPKRREARSDEDRNGPLMCVGMAGFEPAAPCPQERRIGITTCICPCSPKSDRARASVPGQLRAMRSRARPFLRSRTLSLAGPARARPGTLPACVYDTAMLMASLPGCAIVGMGRPVSRM